MSDIVIRIEGLGKRYRIGARYQGYKTLRERSMIDPVDSWYFGRRLALVACIASFVTGLTGTGLLTSVPHSSLLFLLVG